MAEKLTNINKLVTFDDVYIVGNTPLGSVAVIEKITFFSTLAPYNQNKCYEGACYVVFFKNSVSRHVIPLKEVKGIEVIYVEKEDIKKPSMIEAVAYGDTNPPKGE